MRGSTAMRKPGSTSSKETRAACRANGPDLSPRRRQGLGPACAGLRVHGRTTDLPPLRGDRDVSSLDTGDSTVKRRRVGPQEPGLAIVTRLA